MFPQVVKDQEDYRQSLSFFENLLRKDSDCRLEAEYPLAFNSQQCDHIFIVNQNGERQAGLVSLERDIEIQRGKKAKALFIGSVVTEQAHRNRGLQRQLFHAIEEAAENWKIDFLVLWSSQLEFYEKLRFQLAGLQASWISTFQTPLQPATMGVRVEPSERMAFTEKHFQSFAKKVCRVQRTYEEMQQLFRIPKMTVAYTENAYALLGKGEDFFQVCHEWAGPADEVLACIDALRRLVPNLRILSPGVLHDKDEADVVHAFENANFENRLEYLGLFKCLSSKVQMKGFIPDELQYPFFIWGLDSI